MSDETISEQQQAVMDQYQELHDTLSHAREVCPNDDLRQSLRQQAERVQDLITAMNQADIESRTGAFEALVTQINSVNDDLGKLRTEIATIGQNIAIAAKVTGAIDSVISTAAKLLA
jgi:chromosome segregation ATPase